MRSCALLCAIAAHLPRGGSGGSILDSISNDLTLAKNMVSQMRGGKAARAPAKPSAAELELSLRASLGSSLDPRTTGVCACTSPCTFHRTQPQDPLPWCYTGPKCLHATEGAKDPQRELCELPHASGKLSKLTSCTGFPPIPPRCRDGVFWRHCGRSTATDRYDHGFWRWPAMTSPKQTATLLDVKRRAKQGLCCSKSFAQPCSECSVGPYQKRGQPKMREDPKHTIPLRFREIAHGRCADPATHRSGRRHFVYQTACPNDGLGANANNFKAGLLVAQALHFKLVWNQANFVSENSPQYVAKDGSLLHPLSDTPSDLFHPLGLDLCAPSVGEHGVTAHALFDRVAQGQVEALVVSAGTIFETRRGIGAWARDLRRKHDPKYTGLWPSPMKERVVILRGCHMVLGWAHQEWYHDAFEQARAIFRPAIPPSLAVVSPRKYAVAVHVRWGDVSDGVWKSKHNAWMMSPSVYDAMVDALFRDHGHVLSCANTQVVFVAQATKRDQVKLKAALSKGVHAPCSSFVLRQFKNLDGPQSAVQLFAALDVFSSGDVFVGGGGSQFTKLAAVLMHPAGLRIVRLATAYDFSGIPNVISTCSSGRINDGLVEHGWKHRYDKPHAMHTDGCACGTPLGDAEGCLCGLQKVLITYGGRMDGSMLLTTNVRWNQMSSHGSTITLPSKTLGGWKLKVIEMFPDNDNLALARMAMRLDTKISGKMFLMKEGAIQLCSVDPGHLFCDMRPGHVNCDPA